MHKLLWLGGIPLSKSGATHYHAHRTSRQRLCNQMIGCLQWMGSKAFEDLLNGLALGCYQPYPEVGRIVCKILFVPI